MSDRIAIVTGGTKGLGRQISLLLAKAHYKTIAIYLKDSESAQKLEHDFQDLGILGSTLQLDISKAEELVSKLLPLVPAQASELVLINNACPPFGPKPLHLFNWTDYSTQLDGLLHGSFNCIYTLLKQLSKVKKASVVQVLSQIITEDPPPKGFAPYSVAKAAQLQLAKSLAAEFGPRGLRVFCIAPKYMETDLTKSWDDRLRNLARSNGEDDPTKLSQNILEALESDTKPGSSVHWIATDLNSHREF